MSCGRARTHDHRISSQRLTLSRHTGRRVLEYVVKYDVSQIPVDFMCDQKTLQDLTVLSTHDINDSYNRFSNTVKCNMNEHLPSKRVRMNGEKRNHHHTLMLKELIPI